MEAVPENSPDIPTWPINACAEPAEWTLSSGVAELHFTKNTPRSVRSIFGLAGHNSPKGGFHPPAMPIAGGLGSHWYVGTVSVVTEGSHLWHESAEHRFTDQKPQHVPHVSAYLSAQGRGPLSPLGEPFMDRNEV